MDWTHQVLEELIYERVRVHVDLAELLEFEQELNESIGRALREVGGKGGDDPESLTRKYVEAAWRRVEDEWRRERDREDEDCPLCSAPMFGSPLAQG